MKKHINKIYLNRIVGSQLTERKEFIMGNEKLKQDSKADHGGGYNPSNCPKGRMC